VSWMTTHGHEPSAEGVPFRGRIKSLTSLRGETLYLSKRQGVTALGKHRLHTKLIKQPQLDPRPSTLDPRPSTHSTSLNCKHRSTQSGDSISASNTYTLCILRLSRVAAPKLKVRRYEYLSAAKRVPPLPHPLFENRGPKP